MPDLKRPFLYYVLLCHILSYSVESGSLTGPRTMFSCVDPSQCWCTESFSHLRNHTCPFYVGLGIWVLVLSMCNLLLYTQPSSGVPVFLKTLKQFSCRVFPSFYFMLLSFTSFFVGRQSLVCPQHIIL